MFIIFIRTLIIFITLVVVMRLMGKRQIGEMQPFEFIITLIIADLACIPMADVSIPLLYGVSAVLCLFLLHQILSFSELLGDKAKKIISGKPSIVINKNGIDIKELKSNNMGIEDLIESMRSMGYFNLDDVNYAIYESNGKLSTMKKVTEIQSEKPNSLPLLIIGNGKINKTNLNKIGMTKNEVENFLLDKKEKIKSTEVMTIDGNGRIYFKSKNKNYCIFNILLKEGIKW